jgi:hypothetical protein
MAFAVVDFFVGVFEVVFEVFFGEDFAEIFTALALRAVLALLLVSARALRFGGILAIFNRNVFMLFQE